MKNLIKQIIATTTITTSIIVALSLCILPAQAADYAVNIGLWSEHTINDGPELNEKNQLVQLTMYEERINTDQNRMFTTAGTFVNSHYVRSYFVGAGREWVLIDDTAAVGAFIATIKGYEGHIDTMVEGLLIIPVVYFDYEMIRIATMGPAVNVSLKYEF